MQRQPRQFVVPDHPPKPRLGLQTLSLCVCFAALLTACSPPTTIGRQHERQRLAQIAYPADAAYGPDLDIVAERDGSTLKLINRTPAVYRDVVLWLNQQYVRDVTRIALGEGNIEDASRGGATSGGGGGSGGNRFDLTRFVNNREEPFPVGTFLAPDKAFPLVLTELYNPETGLKHRLLTWPDDTTP